MWKRKGENKNNGQKSGQWFRVTTDARARERESTMFVNASIRVFLSRGARSPPTLWIQLSPYLARQRRCGGRRSRGGRREEERNESKRIVWIAKMSAVWEAHRLIIIPNIISQQRWFHSFPSTFLPFFFLFSFFSRSAYDSTEFLLLVQRTTHFSLSRVNSIWKKWKRFFARIRFSNALSVLRSLFKPSKGKRKECGNNNSRISIISWILLFKDTRERERFWLEEWINKDYSCDHECAIKLNGGIRDRSNCVGIETRVYCRYCTEKLETISLPYVVRWISNLKWFHAQIKAFMYVYIKKENLSEIKLCIVVSCDISFRQGKYIVVKCRWEENPYNPSLIPVKALSHSLLFIVFIFLPFLISSLFLSLLSISLYINKK